MNMIKLSYPNLPRFKPINNPLSIDVDKFDRIIQSFKRKPSEYTQLFLELIENFFGYNTLARVFDPLNTKRAYFVVDVQKEYAPPAIYSLLFAMVRSAHPDFRALVLGSRDSIENLKKFLITQRIPFSLVLSKNDLMNWNQGLAVTSNFVFQRIFLNQDKKSISQEGESVLEKPIDLFIQLSYEAVPVHPAPVLKSLDDIKKQKRIFPDLVLSPTAYASLIASRNARASLFLSGTTEPLRNVIGVYACSGDMDKIDKISEYYYKWIKTFFRKNFDAKELVYNDTVDIDYFTWLHGDEPSFMSLPEYVLFPQSSRVKNIDPLTIPFVLCLTKDIDKRPLQTVFVSWMRALGYYTKKDGYDKYRRRILFDPQIASLRKAIQDYIHLPESLLDRNQILSFVTQYMNNTEKNFFLSSRILEVLRETKMNFVRDMSLYLASDALQKKNSAKIVIASPYYIPEDLAESLKKIGYKTFFFSKKHPQLIDAFRNLSEPAALFLPGRSSRYLHGPSVPVDLGIVIGIHHQWKTEPIDLLFHFDFPDDKINVAKLLGANKRLRLLKKSSDTPPPAHRLFFLFLDTEKRYARRQLAIFEAIMGRIRNDKWNTPLFFDLKTSL